MISTDGGVESCGSSRGYMSDIGRLFRQRAAVRREPIENFTTEALAIAIGHDHRPIVRAFSAISWPSGSPFDPQEVQAVEARTQHFLAPVQEIRFGYLDLVLGLTFRDGSTRTLWVEVKVDSMESGDQLDVYAAHIRRLDPRPAIFILSKTELRALQHHPEGVELGWLSWRALADAIENGPDDEDRRWKDLVAFLYEEGVAWRPLPANTTDPTLFIPVLWTVNRQIREHWPNVGMDWRGDEPQLLRSGAVTDFQRSGRLVTTGGPLTYGLVLSGDESDWYIGVGARNYQRVPLDSAAIIRRADQAGISDQWTRPGSHRAVLESRAALRDLPDHASASAWFAERLDELHAKRVLQDFLDGVAARRSDQTPHEGEA
jgi:hypothetical protein